MIKLSLNSIMVQAVIKHSHPEPWPAHRLPVSTRRPSVDTQTVAWNCFIYLKKHENVEKRLHLLASKPTKNNNLKFFQGFQQYTKERTATPADSTNIAMLVIMSRITISCHYVITG